MSQDNVELIRRLRDAWNRPDIDALVALLSPDVVWEENPEFPGLGEVYRGRAGVRTWSEEILEVWEGSHVELEEITQLADDRVLTEAVIVGRGRGGGVPVELRFWMIFWFAAGEIKRRQVFWVRDDALEAAGLAE